MAAPESPASVSLPGQVHDFLHCNPKNLSEEEVYEWAIANGLEKYGIPEILKENDINGQILLELSGQVMKDELHIASWGARHYFMMCIKALQQMNRDSNAEAVLSMNESASMQGKQKKSLYKEHLTIRDYGIAQYLQEIPLLENLEMSDLALIGAAVMQKKFANDQILLKMGDHQTHFYIIREGKCTVQIPSSEEQSSRTVATLSAGDFFGEQGLTRNEQAPCTIISKGEVTVWLVSIKFTRSVLRKTHILDEIVHREAISASVSGEQYDIHSAPQNVIRRKSRKVKANIVNALRSNVLFESIGIQQVDAIVDLMWKQSYEPGQIVIKEGDMGDFFYLIESGSFDVYVQDDGKYNHHAATLTEWMTFGELSLMYNAPRAATIKSSTPTICWVLDRHNVRRILLNYNAVEMQKREAFLRSIPMFEHLIGTEVSVLASACDQSIHEEGESIVTQGEKGVTFYILEEGTMDVIKDGETISRLSVGNYFGERALLKDEVRAATVTCTSKCTLLHLDRHAFKLLLGPLHTIMHRTMEQMHNPEEEEVETEMPPCPNCVSQITDVKQLKSLCILGSGAFGQVRLVQYQNVQDGKKITFALKQVEKSKVKSKGQVQHIQNERNLMMEMNSFFIVRLYQTFESERNLYFLMEPCLGGELFTYIRDGGPMGEPEARFYIGCVILGVEAMHKQAIIYRDLKPENLMMSKEGYLKITDFGFAKKVTYRTYTLCGTPDYLAPEVIKGKGHSYGVDWWTVGILIFELLHSFPPFYSKSHMKTYRAILRDKVSFPDRFSKNVKLLISGLLQKRKTQRLGMIKGGVDRIKQHRWFQKFDWEALAARQMKAPHVPKITDPCDSRNFDDYPDKKKGRMSNFAISDFTGLDDY